VSVWKIVLSSRDTEREMSRKRTGLLVSPLFFDITVPPSTLSTSTAVSWELPPTRTRTAPPRSAMLSSRLVKTGDTDCKFFPRTWVATLISTEKPRNAPCCAIDSPAGAAGSATSNASGGAGLGSAGALSCTESEKAGFESGFESAAAATAARAVAYAASRMKAGGAKERTREERMGGAVGGNTSAGSLGDAFVREGELRQQDKGRG
jgi:hypothetical protein